MCIFKLETLSIFLITKPLLTLYEKELSAYEIVKEDTRIELLSFEWIKPNVKKKHLGKLKLGISYILITYIDD